MSFESSNHQTEADGDNRTTQANAMSGDFKPRRRQIQLPVSTNNLILIVMCVLGAMSFYVLRMGVGPKTANAAGQVAELQVESAINLFGNTAAAAKSALKVSEIMQKLDYDMRDRQILVSELVGNPFVFQLPTAGTQTGGNSDGTAYSHAGAVRQDSEQAQALDEAAKLSLQSVLMSSNGAMAMISDNLLAKGQSINGWTVSSIEEKKVTLTWRDKTHIMEMPE